MSYSRFGRIPYTPPFGSGINWNNSITAGIDRLWVFNMRGGTPNDLTRYSPLTLTVPTWSNGLKGSALSFDGSTSYGRATNRNGLSNVNGRARGVFVICQPASDASGQCVFGKWGNSAPRQYDFRIFTSNTGKWSFGWCDPSNEEKTENANTFVAGQVCTISASHRGITNASGLIFVNGFRQSGVSFVQAGQQNDCDMTVGCSLNGASVTPAEFFNGMVYVAVAWRRALSEGEHKELYVNPNCLFAPIPYRRYFVPSSGGTFKPAWASKSKLISGGVYV